MSKENYNCRKIWCSCCGRCYYVCRGAFGTFVASEYSTVKSVAEPDLRVVASTVPGAQAQDIYNGNPIVSIVKEALLPLLTLTQRLWSNRE